MTTLRAWRQRKAWSADDLAEKAGVSNKTISDIELGKVRPKFRTIRRICAALDVEPSDVEEFTRTTDD
jgi:transcriptional regulator with XRE-family HTH domain